MLMGHVGDSDGRAVHEAAVPSVAPVGAAGDPLPSGAPRLVERLVTSRRAVNLETSDRLRVIAALWDEWTPDDSRRAADRRAGRRDTSAESVREGSVVDEVARGLRLSKTAASQWVEAAVALVVEARLPIADRLCADGEVDWARVHALVDRTRNLTVEQARAVEQRVLAKAVRELTIGRFMNAVDRAVLAVDPEAAEKRRAATRDGRRVSFFKQRDGSDSESGAASLWVSGPAESLAAAWACLDAAARRLRDDGDTRTLDQLRHDLLVTGCTTGALPVAQDVLPFARSAGVSDAAAREAGADGEVVGTAPRPPVPAHITVTMSLQTLLGLNDHPAELDGYGAISAQMARDLARDGIWRCAAVDDTHGTLLGLGRRTWTPGYVPGKALRDFLTIAGSTCSVPWCDAAAVRCDIDHHTPYASGGATCLCNTGPACRRHHREKSAGCLRVEPSTDPAHPLGTTVWTTSAGQRVVVLPYAPLPPEAYRASGVGDDTVASGRGVAAAETGVSGLAVVATGSGVPDADRCGPVAGPVEGLEDDLPPF